MDRLQNSYIIVFTASHKNSLQHLQQYPWPMSSSQHEVTYHYATLCVPHSLCRDGAFDSFARSHILQFWRIQQDEESLERQRSSNWKGRKHVSLLLKQMPIFPCHVCRKKFLFVFIYYWKLIYSWRILVHFLSSRRRALVKSWSWNQALQLEDQCHPHTRYYGLSIPAVALKNVSSAFHCCI